MREFDESIWKASWGLFNFLILPISHGDYFTKVNIFHLSYYFLRRQKKRVSLIDKEKIFSIIFPLKFISLKTSKMLSATAFIESEVQKNIY